MSRLRLARDERGVAMLISVFMAGILLVMAVTLIDTMRSESDRSASAAKRQGSLDAAEAGVDDYIAKLIDDRGYYLHLVHAAESTRTAPGGVVGVASSTWTGGISWTYPSGKDTWRPLGNGFEYNLQITPPSATSKMVTIIASGRPTADANTGNWRVLESRIRPSSIADFQMAANADITYGSAASTYGELYAGIDSLGVAHNITHWGTAHANIYAEGAALGTTNMQDGAQKYGSATIRSQIKNPINFASFLTSISDIQRAAQVGGVYLNDPTKDGWEIKFLPNGEILVRGCTKKNGDDIALTAPQCTATQTQYAVPANGAIYSAQSVMVSGQVNGRVTVASADRVVIQDNISYVTSGDDVLGLVSTNDMIVAYYAPNNLDWRAGTIAQNGYWRSWNNDLSHGTMTFTGSTATHRGGYMSMFTSRNYIYDETLLYLPPPWFPTIEDAYSIVFFRELPPA